MQSIRRYATALLLGTAALLAQGPVSIMPLVPQQPNYTQLKAYLNLSDTQVQALEDIYKSRMTAQQAIYQQISAKQTQLNQLLASGTGDANTVGQLMIDIRNLQKQLPIPASTYRAQALKALNPDQQAKLPALVAALQVQQAAWQAVTLDLVDAPAPAPIVPLAAAELPPEVDPQP
jgi:Spy/CpxP family protein refolding chaperone